MTTFGKLKPLWDQYRLAKQYPNQGECLEDAAAAKRMTCPRCKSNLKRNEDYLYYHCSNPRCSYKEGTDRDKYIKSHTPPPAGSDYWVTTVEPPLWFWRNEFKSN